ncbi:MAG: ATP-binding cassette domain-containing protein [Actinobacteria bacterium]|nr:ATP-binding cassette domain-containing protein [Actinomycetota bacterium]
MSKLYRRANREVLALDEVSLSVEPGKLVAVIGGRGSGKTTLMKIAAGLEQPDSGRVLIGGRRLDQMSDRELTRMRRGEMSCVWGSPVPIGGSVVQDLVALPIRMLSGDARTALRESGRALSLAGVSHCADASINELSDGERRLVHLAQAIVTKPRLMLLDQPASDLNIVDEKLLINVLRNLAADARVAVLMTARNANEATTADEIATLRSGTIIAGASPAMHEPAQANVLPLDGHRRDAGRGDASA